MISKDFFVDRMEINEKRIFPVMVTATMSSGKSTLINALLDEELLPNSNAACTAKVYSILDDDNNKNTCAILTDVNGNIKRKTSNIKEVLAEANVSDEISEVMVVSEIKGIKNTDKSMLIIDTPGPNNSRDDKHENVTLNALKHLSGGLILYILNATQFGIRDDRNLLDKIKQQTLKYPDTKVLFVVNKVDQLDFEKESLYTLIKDVVNYLETIGFKNPDVIPVSAIAANLFKKALRKEKMSRREFNEFINLYEIFESKDFNLNRYVVNDGNMPIDDKINVNGLECSVKDLNNALENTGITLIEDYIQSQQILNGNGFGVKVRIKRK